MFEVSFSEVENRHTVLEIRSVPTLLSTEPALAPVLQAQIQANYSAMIPRLERHMAREKMSQSDLSREIDCAQATISKFMRGQMKDLVNLERFMTHIAVQIPGLSQEEEGNNLDSDEESTQCERCSCWLNSLLSSDSWCQVSCCRRVSVW